ncbi:MAG: peroxiredoxin family protein [Thermomicrobiales bacterium]
MLSISVAAAIVLAAWFIGGRQGFDQIGSGGVNQELLPKVGEVAPDFTVYDLNGRPVSLSEFRGQPVWLNFWGSWCAPCRSEMPEIQRAYEQLAPQGLVLLAISMRESPDEAAAFAARNDVTFTILTDQYEQATGVDYALVNFPTHIFIDRQGRVHTIVLAEMDAETALDHGRALIAAS